MDNTANNNSNFAPSISNNDINAQALTGQTQPNPAYVAAPLQAVTPVPTWLPPQPEAQAGTLSQYPPAPAVTTEAIPPAPPDPNPAPVTNGWHQTASPAPVGQADTQIPPAGTIQAQPWTPPPVDQNIPNPPLPSPAVSPAAEMAAAPQQPSPAEPQNMPAALPPTMPAPAPTPEVITASPTSAWPTPPGTPAAEPIPEPNLAPLAKIPVFPPQFSDQTVAAPTPSWPAQPEPAQSEPAALPATPPPAESPNPFTNFSTPQPPSNQAAGSSTFVPQMENLTPSIPETPPPFTQPNPQSTTFGAAPLPAAAPTVPDFLAGFNNQNNTAPTGFSLSNREPPQTPIPSPDTTLTDLSSMGNPPNGQVYNPAITTPEVGVMPSGIPEAVAHSNRPRFSKSIIIGAAVATLLVIGSASYLLFFSPKPGTPEDTISLPVQAPLTKPKLINTPIPAGAATQSATSSGESSSSGSAFDLLKKKASPAP